MIVPVTDDQLKEIQNAFPRSQAEIDQDLAIIKHWLNKQPHLPKTSDEMLKKMMFSLKYRKEKVKLVVENYYLVKETFPQIYGDLDPATDNFRRHVDAAYVFPLPKLTPELNRVLCYGIATSDANEICSDFQLKRHEMMWNWLFDKDPLTLNNVWIFDLTNMNTLAHWSHFNLSFMKKVLKLNLEAKPVRIKRVHFVNVSSVAETTLNLIKIVFPKKFKDRIFFNSNSEVLQDLYPVEMLPNEWGGKAGTLAELNQRMHEEMIKCRNWFLDMEQTKADSSKRIVQSKSRIEDSSILGIEGNFKTISFD